MTGFWRYFWMLYMLFFAVPFPMIIYYASTYGKESPDTAPWLALTWLALSAALWGLVLGRLARRWIVQPFVVKKNFARLAKAGVRKEGRILESKVLRTNSSGAEARKITFSLTNFTGTTITEEMELTDTQPALRRYEKGKTITLLVDDTLRSIPVICLEDMKVGVKVSRMLWLGISWCIVTAAVIYYYQFSYVLENEGTGWRFLRFYHPLVLCPLILLAEIFFFTKLLRFIGGKPSDLLRTKYYGIRTDAEIVSANQTGTYINEQPQIRFELRFKDSRGRTYTATLKKVISLLDLGITKQPLIPIFYQKDHPEKIAFASDLED